MVEVLARINSSSTLARTVANSVAAERRFQRKPKRRCLRETATAARYVISNMNHNIFRWTTAFLTRSPLTHSATTLNNSCLCADPATVERPGVVSSAPTSKRGTLRLASPAIGQARRTTNTKRSFKFGVSISAGKAKTKSRSTTNCGKRVRNRECPCKTFLRASSGTHRCSNSATCCWTKPVCTTDGTEMLVASPDER